jgi:hypothetical protein
MIVRLFLVIATLLTLNIKAFGYTSIVVGNDQRAGTYYTATDRYSIDRAAEMALSKCRNGGMAGCHSLLWLFGTDTVRFCLGVVVQRSSRGSDTIYYKVARTGSEAISAAEAECNTSARPSCLRRELVCDPESADDFSTIPDNSVVPSLENKAQVDVQAPTDQVQTTFRLRTLKIIDYIRDGLKSVEALVFYSVAFGFAVFVLLSLYDVIAHDRRSVRRMALNLVLSCVATAGIVTTGFVMPPIWEWILSLDTPAIVLLTTMICGMMLLFIPHRFWRKVKERNTLERTSIPETPEESTPTLKVPKAELNKKAIKEAALRSRTEEFDV